MIEFLDNQGDPTGMVFSTCYFSQPVLYDFSLGSMYRPTLLLPRRWNLLSNRFFQFIPQWYTGLLRLRSMPGHVFSITSSRICRQESFRTNAPPRSRPQILGPKTLTRIVRDWLFPPQDTDLVNMLHRIRFVDERKTSHLTTMNNPSPTDGTRGSEISRRDQLLWNV